MPTAGKWSQKENLMAPSQRDVILLFAARSVRLFGYGALAVVLALYLHATGLSGAEIGLLFLLGSHVGLSLE